jgi:hypothetical protein
MQDEGGLTMLQDCIYLALEVEYLWCAMCLVC